MSTVNPPRRWRAAIYIGNTLCAPLVTYAFAKGWIGELEVTLYGAEAAAAFLLAGLNTAPSAAAPTPPNQAEVVFNHSNLSDKAIADAVLRHRRRGGK